MKRAHCSNHCRACGSHFSSVQAFDAHRQFDEGHKDDWDHRICVEPADIETLRAKTTDGVCAVSFPLDPLEHVTVYAHGPELTSEQRQALRGIGSEKVA